MSRYLITSSNPKTWKFDRPLTFLGEFTRTYETRHIWSQLDAIVAEPYGLSLENRERDYEYVTRLRRELFDDIFIALNLYHKVNYDKRFWLILLGDWLTRYVDVIFNRVRTLDQCISKYQISRASILVNNKCLIAPENSYTSINTFNDNLWNEALIGLILKRNYPHLHVDQFDILDHEVMSSNKTRINEIKKKIRSFRGFLNKKLFKIFGRQEDGVIISSYLPPSLDLQLQLNLKQFPARWSLGHQVSVSLDSKYDLNERDALNCLIKRKESDEPILRDLKDFFNFCLPVAYLEGFKELNNLVEKLPWPKKPKFIFTSNNYDFDDIFKLYTAINNYKFGSKYYIGCHGGGFFSYFENPSNSELVCDKFITWGWDHGAPKNQRGFIFTTIGKKIKNDCSGKLFLIEHPLLNRVTTWDVYGDHEAYFNKQTKFVRLLNESPRLNLVVRFHTASKVRGWFDNKKWLNFDSSLNINQGDGKFHRLITKSRLLVFGYDSTGFAEAMSLNIPALVFFQVGFDQLNNYSKSYYLILLKIGIAHIDPETMAKKVNEIWGDVNGWWKQKSVQDARLQFCDEYARTSQNPVKELKEILLS